LLDGFLSDLEANIFAQREQLETNELFAEVLPKALAHAAEELDCDYAIILIIVIMSHLDDVFKYEISPVLVIEFVGH
jgi:hypothetical protein